MDILQNTFLGNSLEHWLIALAWAVGGIIVARILYKVVGSIARKITSKTRSNLDDLIVDKLEEPLVLALTIVALRTAYAQLSFGDGVDEFVDTSMKAAYALNITWGIARLVDAVIMNFFVPFTLRSDVLDFVATHSADLGRSGAPPTGRAVARILHASPTRHTLSAFARALSLQEKNKPMDPAHPRRHSQ